MGGGGEGKGKLVLRTPFKFNIFDIGLNEPKINNEYK
jgi:hypothetical protein